MNKQRGLSAQEAGWLLQKTESQVRGMLRKGELRYATSGGNIDPESVRSLLPDELVEWILNHMVAGAVIAPRPEARYGEPEPLPRSVPELMVGLMFGMVFGGR